MKHVIPGKAIIDIHAARSIVLRNTYADHWVIEIGYKGAVVTVSMDSEGEAKVEFDRLCAAVSKKRSDP